MPLFLLSLSLICHTFSLSWNDNKQTRIEGGWAPSALPSLWQPSVMISLSEGSRPVISQYVISLSLICQTFSLSWNDNKQTRIEGGWAPSALPYLWQPSIMMSLSAGSRPVISQYVISLSLICQTFSLSWNDNKQTRIEGGWAPYHLYVNLQL